MVEVRKRLSRFLFEPESPAWLSILRIGLGLQVSLYALSLRRDWIQLFTTGNQGLIRRDLTEALLSADSRVIPRIGWFVELGARLGLGEDGALRCVWVLLLVGSILLVLGLFGRAAAIVTWLLYVCSAKSAELFSYGVDNFTIIGLFYLAVAPLPDGWSLDVRWRGVPLRSPSVHGFHRRVLQFHMCIIYFFGGMSKCAGKGWWNGESLWRALTRPPFDVVAPEILIRAGALLAVTGVCVCVMEATYPVFIWSRRTRLVWFGGVLAMHVGIGLMMGMYLFASVMIVLNLAAFGPDFAFRLPKRLAAIPTMSGAAAAS
jgi:hypothetical protein